ncbi:MAG TPA: ATP-dependent 6-phosphofructokinase, partial [Bacillota bacterium]
ILRSARSERFRSDEGQREAAARLRAAGIDGLVVIGGDGSLRGALALSALGVSVCGIPATIDNDVPGSERAIGFDTAVNTVVAAVDRIRDTATSHERTFVIEVMGRASGAIALAAGLACGAESILIPELPIDYDDICRRLLAGFARGKAHSILIVAEGAAGAYQVAAEVSRRTGLDTRVTVLGHVQRGGSPTAADRILATRCGAAAALALRAQTGAYLTAVAGDRVEVRPLAAALHSPPPAPVDWARLAVVLAR